MLQVFYLQVDSTTHVDLSSILDIMLDSINVFVRRKMAVDGRWYLFYTRPDPFGIAQLDARPVFVRISPV